MRPPSGCRFHPRCPHAMAVCSQEDPPLVELSPERSVACHLHRAAIPISQESGCGMSHRRAAPRWLAPQEPRRGSLGAMGDGAAGTKGVR